MQTLELTDEDGQVPEGPNGQPIDLLVGNTGQVTIVVFGDVGSGADTETFTLRAVGGGGEASRSVALDVAVALPIIDDFRPASGNVVAFGEPVSVEFTVRNTTRVLVQFDGNTCVDVDAPANGVSVRRTCARDVTNPSHTLTLLAGNVNTPELADYSRAEFTVTGAAPIVIDSFTVDRDSYWEGTGEIVVSWMTSNADMVQIARRSIQGGQTIWTPIAGSPTTPDGSFTLTLIGEEEANLRLRATRGGDVRDDFRTVIFGFDEPEPNSSTAEAIQIPADGISVRGTLSAADDVDVFEIQVPENGRVYAVAGQGSELDLIVGSASCELDTSIDILDAAGMVLGTATDNRFATLVANVPATCAELTPQRHAFARNLAAGTYFLRVSGPAAGQYRLLARTFVPPELRQRGPGPVAEPVFERTRVVGGPQWEVSEMNLLGIPWGPARNRLTRPFFISDYGSSFVPGVVYSLVKHLMQVTTAAGDPPPVLYPTTLRPVLGQPVDAHVDGFDSEIRDGATVMNLDVNDFLVEPWHLGIEDTTRAPATGSLALAYTIVPTDTAPVGTSVDSDNLGLPGTRILPVALSPFTLEVQRLAEPLDDNAYFDENLARNMMGNLVERIPQPHPLVAEEANFEGLTHRHFFHWFHSVIAQRDLVNMSGRRLVWSIAIRDAAGNGYDYDVTFEVQ
ncbi:MAG: hypothetical protein HC923_01705 [Myxococcales bacterium]|nr:hypothetical protein [Myxococcales bacterium]